VSARRGPARSGRFADRDGARRSNPWVIRAIVAVAVVLVVVGLVYAAVNGILFSLPSH
jgi:hypothetical protein